MIMRSVSLAAMSEGEICEMAWTYCWVNGNERGYHAVSAEEVTNEDNHGSFSGVEARELDFSAILIEDLELASLLERFGGKNISHDDDGQSGEVESGR